MLRQILSLPSHIFAALYYLAVRNRWVKPRVYDCFILYEERELFELRLHELSDIVDIHVVVEGSLTFSGKTRHSFVGPEIIQGLPPYLRRKIRYIQIHEWEYPPGISDVQWEIEYFTRNQIIRGLYDLRNADFVWLCDVDEIPRTTSVFKLGSLDMILAHYKYNLISSSTRWRMARAITGYAAKKHSMTGVRIGQGVARRVVPDAGWHFSFIMTPEQISDKIKAFSHQEFNTGAINNLPRIKECMDAGRSILSDEPGDFVRLNDLGSLPNYLLENLDKYSPYLD